MGRQKRKKGGPCFHKQVPYLHRIIAIGHINEAVDQGNPEKTLEALLLPTAKLQDVRPVNARHYQDVLHHAKAQK
uniref:Uncharacterized protein n=1 Tax=Cyanistes caeruleus TaxID=156563 RepID=A0A8C0U122_CYACU